MADPMQGKDQMTPTQEKALDLIEQGNNIPQYHHAGSLRRLATIGMVQFQDAKRRVVITQKGRRFLEEIRRKGRNPLVSKRG